MLTPTYLETICFLANDYDKIISMLYIFYDDFHTDIKCPVATD